jgi:serine/threonine-protein kinase
MGAAYSPPPSNGSETTAARKAAGPGVLDTIAQSIGAVPRVLLRDTAPGENPGPIVRTDGNGTDASIRYRIDGEIARGGMGAVLKGRDPDLCRDVALKVLREDHRENGDMVRRFVEEAQIGGQLQHPGIVPVYELGTFADRRPFFTMKLVKGKTLAQLLADRTDPADGRPRFLSIFEAIAQTMAYSHTRGVIHRDLKPSNVMVGSFGEVQVMDWGLAKVLPRGGVADDERAGKIDRQETLIATARSGSDTPGLSQAGSAMGTPAYMAPEQARGEIDRVGEPADVFALGSILCEILTGEPAFLGRSSSEILRKSALGDLDDAIGRLDACGSDAELTALARDCLAREVADRPRDAAEVAGRISAYLAGVQERLRLAEIAQASESARAEEALRTAAEADQRAQAERRARRFQVGLAASLLTLTTMGGLGTTYYLQQRSARAAALERPLREALTLHEVAEKEPEKVERWEAVVAAWQKAEATLGPGSDSQAAEIVAAHLRDAQARADAARSDRTLLDAVADVRSDRAELGHSVTDAAFARAFREAGIDVDALPPAEAGARLKARPASVALAAAAALDAWAMVRREDRPRDSRWRRPLEAARAADSDPFRDRVRAAVLEPADAAREAALRKLAAESKAAELPPASAVLLGAMLQDVASSVALLRVAAGRHPDDVWVNHALAQRLGDLRPAPREEQVRYYSMARAVRPGTAHDLAHLLDDMGRRDEGLAVFADLVARHPADARHLTCYGQCLQDRDARQAKGVFERAVSAGREATRLNPDDQQAHFSLGRALAKKGKLDEAIAEFREVIHLNPDNAKAHNALGRCLAYQERLDEALAECRESIHLKPDEAVLYEALALALSFQGKQEEVVAAYRDELRLKPDSAMAQSNLGCALEEQGKLDEAVSAYREAIRLKPDDFNANCNLAPLLAQQGKLDEAISLCRESILRMPDLRITHRSLAFVLGVRGDFTGSLAEYRKYHELRSDQLDMSESDYSVSPIAWAERKAALADRLPGILKGTDRPRDNAERLDFARMCLDTLRYAAAARLWAEALEADPEIGQDRKSWHLFMAAYTAALAATGRGQDDLLPDNDEKVRLRGQALVWLKADLAAWAKVVDSDPAVRTRAFYALESWRHHSYLASVREPEALAKFPEAERKQWQTLWAAVDALIKRASEKAP